jgi:uncharacterized damage-inducible protein DinB
MEHAFLAATYETERLKMLSTWSLFDDGDLPFRPAADARSVHEHLVHQCLSEEAWFSRMLGVDAGVPPLPAEESRLAFLDHYARASARRLEALASQPDRWFDDMTAFFDVTRSRAWVLTRRIAHSAHHRGQLTIYLRLLGRKLYSTYGPTADTGGLPANGAVVVYRYPSIDALLEAERRGGESPALPDRGGRPVSERPDS